MDLSQQSYAGGGVTGFVDPHPHFSRRDGLTRPQSEQFHDDVGGGFPPNVFTPPFWACFCCAKNRLTNPDFGLCLLSAMPVMIQKRRQF